MNFPILGKYDDFNVTKGSTYFWQYKAHTNSSLGYFARASMMKRFTKKKVTGFHSAGAGYRLNSSSVDYSGWEGGGVSGLLIQGSGTRTWEHHSIDFFGSMNHQYFIGRKNYAIVSGLTGRASFLAYTRDIKTFSGNTYYNDGSTIADNAGFSKGKVNGSLLVPLVALEASAGILVTAGSYLISPTFRFRILDLSQYYNRPKGFIEPLDLRQEYFQDVMLSIIFMSKAAN